MKFHLNGIFMVLLAFSITTPCFAEENTAQPTPQATPQATPEQIINIKDKILGNWRSVTSGTIASLEKDGAYFSTSGDQHSFKKGTYSISDNTLTIQGSEIKTADNDWAEWNAELSFSVILIDEKNLTLMTDDGVTLNYVRTNEPGIRPPKPIKDPKPANTPKPEAAE